MILPFRRLPFPALWFPEFAAANAGPFSSFMSLFLRIPIFSDFSGERFSTKDTDPIPA
jgi:hypothetical protein